MTQKDEQLLIRLQEMFKIEAEERLNTMYSSLLRLEKIDDYESQIKEVDCILREAHSLKGAARAVNMGNIENICQSLENALMLLKRKKINLSAGILDTLHTAIDTVNNLINKSNVGSLLISQVLNQLEVIDSFDSNETSWNNKLEINEKNIDNTNLSEQNTTISETIRVSANKMDSLLLKVEEMLSLKLMVNKFVEDIWEIKTNLDMWKKNREMIYPEIRSIQQEINKKENDHITPVNAKLDKLLDFVKLNELHFIQLLQNKLDKQIDITNRNQQIAAGLVDNLLEEIKSVLMLPFSFILESFPKMVRDISRTKNKEVEIQISGEEVEIDKRILDEIKAPLIHIVRNIIDHGIENPDDRIKIGKSRNGVLTINISHLEGSKVKITISDDGAGINIKELKKAAVNRGFLTEKEAEKFNEKEAIELIYKPEVSTSEIITDISGRGIGLAIVKETIEKLGGKILVESELQTGTEFQLILPVTVSTFRGILVKTNGEYFIVPTKKVERVLRIKHDQIKTVENKETISLNGNLISIVNLKDVLGLEFKETKPFDNNHLFILNTEERLVAFRVDEVLSEQEVLAKSLGKVLSRVRNIAGATVLGSGKVVPILNVFDLVKSATKISTGFVDVVKTKEKSKFSKKSILVVEDSITSRMLLKNILESAGYHVITAVDGIEGLMLVKRDYFDLVVSDVEMPRMNGFELTEKIRNDEHYSKLPVILVTSLDSKDDRERGIKVGANAFIVKSSFDQSNLLEVIQRLI